MSFTGCASFRAGNLPEISKWPPPPPSSEFKPRMVKFYFNYEYTVNGIPQRVDIRMADLFTNQVQEAYVSSGLFKIADPKIEPQNDYIIEVKIKDTNKVDPYSILWSSLTLLIKQGEATDDYVLTTTVKTRKGDDIGTIEKSERVIYKQGLAFFPQVFANLPDVAVKKTIYDLARASINEAISKGIIR